MTERDVNMYSPLTLAFLGDSVYDTLVREKLLRSANMPASKLHSAKIKLVCAEFQSKAYDVISEVLTPQNTSDTATLSDLTKTIFLWLVT